MKNEEKIPPNFCPLCKWAKKGFEFMYTTQDEFDWWICNDCEMTVGLSAEWSILQQEQHGTIHLVNDKN